jgi:hypothetical protein
MYLRQAFIENSGSLKWLNFTPGFTASGFPKPVILVGGNGSGKTNFLSIIADALFEAAASHYNNVLPSQGVGGRAWFRVVGTRNLTVGSPGGFSLLRFEHAGTSLFFKERAGQVDFGAASTRLPRDFSQLLQTLAPGDGIKSFTIEPKAAQTIFTSGVYVYFPSSRSEVPYWLNREAVPDLTFDTSQKFSQRLSKPIYVEHALEEFKQWLIAVLADSRVEITSQIVVNGQPQWAFVGNPVQAITTTKILKACNSLLQDIMSDATASFLWVGRRYPDKIAITRDGKVALPTVDALSAGQSILLGMFGSILRYGDMSRTDFDIDLTSIEGICLIDEVDAHVHIELQHKVLPKLIRLFPKVQFILSSHSPLFVVGMENEFGQDGLQIIEMPSGTSVSAESYAEFGKALDALAATGAFTAKVVAEARGEGKPIVYVEGETDAPYLKRAATLLGRADLLARCDIEWIGAKDEGGQGFNTGKDALKHTLSFLRANPDLARRHILLLHDNDTNIADQDHEGFSVRMLPLNPSNKKVSAGIENLLSTDCFEERFYDTKEITKPRGDTITSHLLRKADLCKALCASGTAEQFAAFDGALNIIESYLERIDRGSKVP